MFSFYHNQRHTKSFKHDVQLANLCNKFLCRNLNMLLKSFLLLLKLILIVSKSSYFEKRKCVYFHKTCWTFYATFKNAYLKTKNFHFLNKFIMHQNFENIFVEIISCRITHRGFLFIHLKYIPLICWYDSVLAQIQYITKIYILYTFMFKWGINVS